MISKKAAVFGAVVIIIVTAFVASFATIQIDRIMDLRNGIISEVNFPIQDYYRIDAVRAIIQNEYLEKPDDEELLVGAIKGMVDSLRDRYSQYYTAEEYQEEILFDLQGTFAGIGVTVLPDKADNYIVVVKPLDDSPAKQAGIIAGDKIVKIDGQEVSAETYNKAISLMRGEPGTEVTVTILRDGVLKDFTMVRTLLENPDLEYRMLEDQIGYIWLYEFDSNAAKNFKNAVARLQEEGMKGLILDLRLNGGGYMEACTSIADALLPEGLILYTEDRKGNRQEYRSDETHLGIPLVVLIDGYSASASEVLAGAVQDYKVGTLVGVTTYGKGVVQTIRGPFKDGSMLKLTTYKYFTPLGRDIHERGIEPDIVVGMSKEAMEYWRDNPNSESLPLELDEPLKRGIEEIKIKLGIEN